MARHRAGSPVRSRGIALVAVLWVLVLLAYIAASFSGSSRTEANLARNMVENTKAEAMADAGIYRAIVGLTIPVDDGGLPANGIAYAWAFGDGEVRFSVRDEGGKIDINEASVGLLSGLFQAVGLKQGDAEAMADAIADFRDEDDDPRSAGAEVFQYEKEGLGYGPKNEPFLLVEELMQVYGMTGELYRRIQPVVTVVSNQPSPNRKTAPAEVLTALSFTLGETPETDEGDGWDEEGQGEDDKLPNLFDERRSGEQGRSEEELLSGQDPDENADEQADQVRSQIDLYAIHAEARTTGGAVFARDAVIELSGDPDDPFTIRRWARGQRSLFPVGSSAS